MTERISGRGPEEFSRAFARKLNGVIGEAEQPPTGQQIARALKRNDGYVSERKNGKRAWTVDDVDVIAGLLKLDGIALVSEVLRRMDPPAADAVTNVHPIRPTGPEVSEDEFRIEDLYDEPSAAHPIPRNDVEGDMDPDLQ